MVLKNNIARGGKEISHHSFIFLCFDTLKIGALACCSFTQVNPYHHQWFGLWGKATIKLGINGRFTKKGGRLKAFLVFLLGRGAFSKEHILLLAHPFYLVFTKVVSSIKKEPDLYCPTDISGEGEKK